MAARSFRAVVGKDGPNPRFSRIETIATNAHVHRVRIRALGELDGAVRRWIDRAYRVGCREHLRRGAEG